MIKAAGILFVTDDGQALFLQRAGGGDHPGEWCTPGGKLEGDETAEQAAIREVWEETGHRTRASDLEVHTRSQKIAAAATVPAGVVETALPVEATPAQAADMVDFTTFLCRVREPFKVTLCDENDGHAWAPVGAPPEPLHPGVRVALARLGMDELGVARAMAAGELTSPQRYQNMVMVAMRVTGTGVAYRQGLDEFAFRAPELYLNDDFLARCNGLPVIMEHPKKATLNSKEFSDRIVGTVFLPYIQGNEVWAITKIWDDPTIQMLDEGKLSTSPSVVLKPEDSKNLTLDDGSALLIEGKPSLLDHLAICEVGVWDKGGDPTGITINDSEDTTAMATEDKDDKKDDAAAVAAKADAARADANAAFMDRMGKFMDSMEGRMDAMEKGRKDSDDDDDKKDKKDDGAKGRKDGDDDDDDDDDKKDKKDDATKSGGRKDGDDDDDDKKDKRDDKSRKDGDDDDDKKDKKDDATSKSKGRSDDDDDDDKKKPWDKDDAVRHDAQLNEVQRRISDVERILPRDRSDEELNAISDAQARADDVFRALGLPGSRPLQGEDLLGYRRRIAGRLQAHSPKWKATNLRAVADSHAFDMIEEGIYNDAVATAHSPVTVEDGELRAIEQRDLTGRTITTFAGQPSAWMSQFTGNRHSLTGINKD